VIVDRIARTMTGGAPRAGFTARVMAPILGQPRPGFTARVMAHLDGPEPPGRANRLRPVLAAAAAIISAAAGALLWLPGSPSLPASPAAPQIAAWPYDRAAIDVPTLPFDRWAPDADRATRAARVPQVTIVHVDEGDAYRIAQLPGTAPIDVRSIDPAPTHIAPLSAPAALSVPEVRFNRETP
jgi:hypothetical protein